MKKIFKILAFAMMLFVALTFTVGTTTNTLNAEAKTKVKLNKAKVTLAYGKTYKLKLKGTKKKVKWSSNKKSIATVSKAGRVKGKKSGKATITAKLGKKKYRCKVTVYYPLGSIKNPRSANAGATSYFISKKYKFSYKITEMYKGDVARNKLRELDEWDNSVNNDTEYKEYSKNARLILLKYNVKNISYSNNISAYRVINSGFINDLKGKQVKVKGVTLGLRNTIKAHTSMWFFLKKGDTDYLYVALYVPNNMNAFLYNGGGGAPNCWVKTTL